VQVARWRLAGGPGPVGRSPIAAGSALLAAYGTARARLDSLLQGAGEVVVRHRLEPARGALALTMGGWPRVVADGRNVAAQADSMEGTFPRFSAQRHPRTAVGMTRDSATLLLVLVDGRPRESGQSVGMTLVELADFLIRIGAWQALNLDGGGSTTLWVRDRVVNTPSDPAGERPVGNALFVLRGSR
jgi:exopolysaccharide biosynthesis protein